MLLTWPGEFPIEKEEIKKSLEVPTSSADHPRR
jgi:hypothetical protein